MRTIRTAAMWVLKAGRACDGFRTGYDVECLACLASSDYVHDDPTPVEVWAIRHTTENGEDHNRFVARTDSYWTVLPRGVDARAYSGALGGARDAGTVLLRPVLPRGARAHARRGRWRGLRRRVRGVMRR